MDTSFVAEHTDGSRRTYRWRVIDIVVASVLAVASGMVFVLWNVAANPIGASLGAVVPGLNALAGGGWLFAGVLTALVIRKPGRPSMANWSPHRCPLWSETNGAY